MLINSFIMSYISVNCVVFLFNQARNLVGSKGVDFFSFRLGSAFADTSIQKTIPSIVDIFIVLQNKHYHLDKLTVLEINTYLSY